MKNELVNLANDYINNNKLHKYLNDIIFVDYIDKNILAAYNLNKKVIEYNMSKINEIDNSEIYSYFVMYHELIHVKQAKIRNKFLFSPEKEILKFEKFLLNHYYDYYMAYYYLVMSEYNADIEAFINTIRYTNDNIKNKFFNEINSYYITNKRSSLYYLYQSVGGLNDYYRLMKKCKYNDAKRILYGFPINNNTFIKIKKHDSKLFEEINRSVR